MTSMTALGEFWEKWHPSVRRLVNNWVKDNNFQLPWRGVRLKDVNQKRAIIFWCVKYTYIVRNNNTKKRKGL